jgi:hypothetical protein
MRIFILGLAGLPEGRRSRRRCSVQGSREPGPLRARKSPQGICLAGDTPPFGYPEPVPAYVDPGLLAFEEVWAAAGTPDAVFQTTATELQRTTAAEVVDLKETGSRNENVPPNR